MYPILVAEMRRAGKTVWDLAELLNIGSTSVMRRMHRGGFSLSEAKKIQREWFPMLTLEEIFLEEDYEDTN